MWKLSSVDEIGNLYENILTYLPLLFAERENGAE